MSVIINLREIFATDSQAAASDKLNFNFNQLLALGVGQPGPIGPQGQTGAAGPAGPIGPQGPTGSVIFGQTTAVAPVTPPVNVPTGLTTGDILIGSDKIYKKTLTGWLEIADFNALVVTAIGSNISPFLRLGGTSRIVKHRVSNGIDLSNSASSSNPTYPTPGVGTNYQTVLYNFNELKTRSFKIDQFGNISISSNAGTEKTFTASSTGAVNISTNQITITSHGFSNGTYVTYTAEGGTPVGGLSDNTGYYVLSINSNTLQLCETAEDVTNNNPIDLTGLGAGSNPHKLTSYPSPPDAIFPATSNLSLYSFYDNAATTAKEFETNPTARGYRAQLEIGSVDTLPAAYPGGLSSTEYLISPSFENLRIRKYRLGGFSISGGSVQHPGTYMLRAEYDISSSGLETNALFSPRRNSEHVWRINKAGSSQGLSRTLEMKFTNSYVLDNTEAALGISLDGVFFKRSATFNGTSGSLAAFGIGFNAADNNNTVSFTGSANVTNFLFNKTVIVNSGGSQYTNIAETGITAAASGGGWSITVPTNNLTIQASSGNVLIGANGTMTVQSVGNFVIQASNINSIIRINQAIKVKGDRLDAGLPFPVTQVPSNDVNTLDDYREGTTVVTSGGSAYTGLLGFVRAYTWPGNFFTYYIFADLVGQFAAGTPNDFFVTANNRYTKIGNQVTFSFSYTFDVGAIFTANPATPPAEVFPPPSGIYYINDLIDEGLFIQLPFPVYEYTPVNCSINFNSDNPGLSHAFVGEVIGAFPTTLVAIKARFLDSINTEFNTIPLSTGSLIAAYPGNPSSPGYIPRTVSGTITYTAS